jgi:deoxyribonuclease V
VAAGVWFRGWSAAAAEHEAAAVVREVADYRPGEFYRRELPGLLAVLAEGPPPDIGIVDGYVWLGRSAGAGRPGLGAYLYEALGGRVPVVGVAKTRFASAEAVPVVRGVGRSPLWVTVAGIDPAAAARHVAAMHGPYRVPTLLKRADHLARTAPAAG